MPNDSAHDYDRHLASELEKEEARMEADEMREAEMDSRVDDYVRCLLTDHVETEKPWKLGWYQTVQVSRFQWEVWQDWLDSLDNNLIELVRLNLAAGDDEKAGKAMVESLREHLREIASQAVREDMKL